MSFLDTGSKKVAIAAAKARSGGLWQRPSWFFLLQSDRLSGPGCTRQTGDGELGKADVFCEEEDAELLG